MRSPAKPKPKPSPKGWNQQKLPILNVRIRRLPEPEPEPIVVPVVQSRVEDMIEDNNPWGDVEDDQLVFEASQIYEGSGVGSNTNANSIENLKTTCDDPVPPSLHASLPTFAENGNVQTTLWRIMQNEESQKSQNTVEYSEDTVKQNKDLKSQLEQKTQALYAAQGEITTLRHVLSKRNTGAAQTAAAKTTLLTQKDIRIKAQDSEILKLQKELAALKVDLQFKANQITTQSMQLKQIRGSSTPNRPSSQMSSFAMAPPTPTRASPRRSVSQFPTRKSFMGKEVKPLIEFRDAEVQATTIFKTKEKIQFVTNEEILQSAFELPKLHLRFEASVFLRFLKDRLVDSTLIKNESYFDNGHCKIGVSRNESDIMFNLFNWISKKEESDKIAELELPKRLVTIRLKEAQATLSTEDMFRSGIEAIGTGRVEEAIFFLKQELLAILRTKTASNGSYVMWDLEHIKIFLTLLTLSEHFWNVIQFQELDLKENSNEKCDEIYQSRREQILGDWTELITRAPYIILTSGKYQLENRLRCLKILLAIIKTGYFQHTAPNYYRIQILLMSSCKAEIYRRTDVIYYVMDIIIALSRYTAILPSLCQATSDKKGSCLVELIGQRVYEIFEFSSHEFCNPMGLPLYQKYLSFLELLDDPACTSCADFDQSQDRKAGGGEIPLGSACLRKRPKHFKMVRSKKDSDFELSLKSGQCTPANVSRAKRRRYSSDSDDNGAGHESKKPCENGDSETQFPDNSRMMFEETVVDPFPNLYQEVDHNPETSASAKRILAPEWMWDGQKEVDCKLEAHRFVPNLISWLHPSTWEDQKLKKTLCQCRKSLIIHLQKIQLNVSECWRNVHFRSELAKTIESVSGSQWKVYESHFSKNTEVIHKQMAKLSKDENSCREDIDKSYAHLTGLLTNGAQPSETAHMELTNPHLDDEKYYSQMAASRGPTLLYNLATQTELGAFSFGTEGSQMFHLLAGFNYAHSDEGLPLNEVQSEIMDAMVDSIDESFERGTLPDPVDWDKTVQEFPWLGGGTVPEVSDCPAVHKKFYVDPQPPPTPARGRLCSFDKIGGIRT